MTAPDSSYHGLIETFSLGDGSALSDRLRNEFDEAGKSIGSDRLTKLEGIPNHDRILVSPLLSEGHFLESIITSPDLIDRRKLLEITSSINRSIQTVIIGDGAIPASINDATHYSEHTWTRDAALVALALKRDGKLELAEKALWKILSFYGSPNQRQHFDHYHFSSNPAAEYRNQVRHPHSVAHIGKGGALEELNTKWGHEQLDTIGWLLFLPFRLANEKAVSLEKLDGRLGEEINGYNKFESILPLTIKFLNRVTAWDQPSRGPWEDILARARATDLGMLISGLTEAHKYFSNHPKGWGALPVQYANTSPEDSVQRFQEEHEHVLNCLKVALEQRVPHHENGIAREADEDYLAQDSGMLWLLYPGEIGLSDAQVASVLRTVYRNQSEIGFIRRPGDSYVGQDYAREKHPNVWPDFSRTEVEGFRPAEWTLFDPMIAGFYARKYVESGCQDEELLLRADRHLKRSLAMITTENISFAWYKQSTDPSKSATTVEVNVPAHTFPEAYWYDSEKKTWLPNHNSPLLMANATLALALLRYGHAIDLRERILKKAA